MNTAEPAARPAYSFLEFVDQPCNMLLSRLVFLNKGNPTYPLIARQGRKIFPNSECRTIGSERFA